VGAAILKSASPKANAASLKIRLRMLELMPEGAERQARLEKLFSEAKSVGREIISREDSGIIVDLQDDCTEEGEVDRQFNLEIDSDSGQMHSSFMEY
jgi:hypothetical protein